MWTQKAIHFPLFLFIFLNLSIYTVKCLNASEEPTTSLPCTIDCISEIPNSQCNSISGDCECIEGYISYDPDSNECSEDFDSFSCLLKAKNEYDLCVADIQCTSGIGDLSFCHMYGYCICFANATRMYDEDTDSYKCILNNQPKKLGDICQYRSEECEPIPGSVCTDDICACAWGWVPNSDETACLKEATRVGEICEVDDQCDSVDYTECKAESAGGTGKKSCHCKGGYVINARGTGCSPTQFLGAYCFDSKECFVDHSECLPIDDWTRNCQCTAGYADCFGACCLIQNSFGGQCVYDQQCSEGRLGSFSICDMDKCLCSDNSILGSDGVCHLTATKLGDSCKVDEQCINLTIDNDDSGAVGCMFNYTTGETQCQCAPGFIAAENGLCREMRYQGDPCLSDEDCRAGIGKNAFCLIFEGEEPRQEEEGSGDGSGEEDEWGLCDCAPGFVISTDGTKCIVGELKVNDICSESRQCGTFPRNPDSTDGLMICDAVTNLCKLK